MEEKAARLKRELALAIVLWKQVRMNTKIKGFQAGGRWIAPAAFDAALFSVDLAKSCGVLEEYMTVLTEIPVMTIQVKELEKWDTGRDDRNPFRKK